MELQANKLNKYEVFNKRNEGFISLASAIESYKEQNPGDFNCNVIGYAVESAVYPYKEKDENTAKAQDILYLYTDNDLVIAVNALSCMREFFNIINEFGIPSINKGIKISIKMINKNNRSWYLTKILGTGLDQNDNNFYDTPHAFGLKA